MLMPGRRFSAGTNYRYGFNGKEKDRDINSLTAYDYGFRIYNPGIGKFLSVDPLAKQYTEWTPFQFAENSPIKFIDLDGQEHYDPGIKPTGITHISLANTPGGIMEATPSYWAGQYYLYKTNSTNNTSYYTARRFYESGRYNGMYQDDFIIGPESVAKFMFNVKEYEAKANQFDWGVELGGTSDLSPGGLFRQAKSSWNCTNVMFGLSIFGHGVVSLGSNQVRPTWQESEKDIMAESPEYREQVSFKNGKEVPKGYKGSVRPEGYKPGESMEVKNTTRLLNKKGQNDLVNNIMKQVRQRAANLPQGTKQNIVIDLRGYTNMSGAIKPAALRAYMNVAKRILTQAGPVKISIIGKIK
jgi:RHS repeat-associated protein